MRPLSKPISWSGSSLSIFHAAHSLLCHNLSQVSLSLILCLLFHLGFPVMLQTSALEACSNNALLDPGPHLSFFSRSLSPTEKWYSTFDRELLAAYSSVRHFEPLIEGRSCHLCTDHKPLVLARYIVSDPWSPRQQRHLSVIAEFITTVPHRSGLDNAVADFLSRAPINSVVLRID